MNWTHVLKTTVVTAAILFGALVAKAESTAEINVGVANAMSRFYAQDASHLELSRKAAGILVFPHVTKGGLGIAGEYGEGALLVDGRPTAYYTIGAASVGATAGVGQHSEVILFMTQEALGNFRRSQGWTVGADAQVAVVSKGAGAQYNTEVMKKPILAFMFGEKGLIGDLSIEGAKISIKTS